MIGVGTFGTCQLAKFRNIDAVVKEFKSSTAEKKINQHVEMEELISFGQNPNY